MDPAAPIPDRRRSYARVDLGAIARNAAAIRATLPAGCLLGAVVKADGYGHGAVPAARAALAGGAAWLLIATVPEGIALRRAGIAAARILVLGATAPEEVADLVAADLTPIVDEGSPVEAIAAEAARRGVAPYPVHVKVDTGLTRFGVAEGRAIGFVRRLGAMPDLRVEGVATHFATGDVRDDPFLHEQEHRFLALVRRLDAEGCRPPIVHAANSGAALQGVGRWDLVRIGIALYGIPPSPDFVLPPAVAPALTVHSRVARIIDLAPGMTVGYGRTFTATARGHAAVVPLGYADGLPRSLSNRGALLIGGARCPIIGNVSMDQCVVALPPGCAAGHDDPVVIVGAQGGAVQTITDLARDAATIAYEVAVRFGARLRREYVQGCTFNGS